MKSLSTRQLSSGLAVLLLAGSALMALGQPYPTAVLADSPTAYWRLQETTGTVAIDSAGSDNGSYTNVQLAQPGYNTGSNPSELSVGFGPSTDSYVSGMTLDLASSGNTAFSLEAWVNGGAQNNSAGIFGKGTGGSEEAFLDCFGTGTPFRFFIRNAAGTSIAVSSSTNIPDNNWHHLVGVCDEPNGKILLYVDGQLVASNSASGGIRTSTNLYMSIGSRQSGTANFDDQFTGDIGEVAVYNHALSAAQVQNHYFAAGIPATITQQPINVISADENSTLIIPAAATGTPPLYYQWSANNSALPGQTNATLVLSNLPYSLYGANLVLTVSNLYGTNMSGGTTVYVNSSAPQFVTNLSVTTVSLYQGFPWTYSVSVQGTEPFSYQWYQGGVSIPGATNSNFTTNASLGSNTYYVIVSNSFGGGSTSQSSTATLAGVPLPVGSYPSTIIAAHPIAYWRLDEPETGGGDNGSTAFDYAGGHNGTYSQVLLGVPGYSPLDADTAALFGTNAGFATGSLMQEQDNSGNGLPTIDSTLLGANVEFSVECWAKAAAGGQNSSGSTIVSLGNSGSEAFYVDASGPNGVFRYMARNKAGGSIGIINSSISPDGNWHHLVAVMDEATNGATVFYVDGNLAGTLGGIAGTGLSQASAPLSVGNNGTYQFNGTIDEVSFYNYPLTTAQVAAHLNAAPQPPSFEVVPPLVISSFAGGSVTLSATEIGSTPFTNQWYSNNVILVGKTNVALTLNNLPVGTNLYTLWVTNAYGVTNTPGTTLQVAAGAGPPLFLADVKPLNATIYATESITYSVTVSGSAPLFYQWRSNGVPVPGATTSIYNIANLVTNDAGSYFCSISNQFSNIVSSTAVLSVIPAPTNPYSLTVMKDHAMSYWRLDEANGSTIGFDYVGGNNGIYSNYNGIVHSSGAFGANYDADTAAYFNTNTSYTRQNIGTSNYLGTTMTNVDFSVPNGQNGEFSIEAWAKGYPNVMQASGGGIIAKGYGNGGEEFNIDVHGGFRFYARTAAGTLAGAASSAPYLTGNTAASTNWIMDGLWHHLVGVCDEANNNLLLYVDGNLVGYPVISNGVVPANAGTLQLNHNPQTGTNGAISTPPGGGAGIYAATNFISGNAALWRFNSVSIGSRNSGTNNTGITLAFLGAVDEAAIYNYCLTPLQVSNHFAVAQNMNTTISVQVVAGQNQLSWYPMFGSGVLQSAPTVTGPWTTVIGATSPYTVPTGSTLFYRVKNF